MSRTQNIPENICSFGNGTPIQWAPTENDPAQYDKLISFSSKQNILLNREFYKLSNQGVHASWKSWKCPGIYFCPGICPGNFPKCPGILF